MEIVHVLGDIKEKNSEAPRQGQDLSYILGEFLPSTTNISGFISSDATACFLQTRRAIIKKVS